ncbi:MAG: hypothetical protein R6W76_14270 [Caldilinea sp.]|jgi:hypothetical protein
MVSDVISKPVATILTTLTHEPRLEVAVTLAVKDWLQLRLSVIESQKQAFEEKYGMDFADFRAAWGAGEIADQYSYEVERDYWEWEGLLTDEDDLRTMAESLW